MIIKVDGIEKEVPEQSHHWGNRKLLIDVRFVKGETVYCGLGAHEERSIAIPISRFPEHILKLLDEDVSFVVMSDYDDNDIDDCGINLHVEDAIFFNMLYKPHWTDWVNAKDN